MTSTNSAVIAPVGVAGKTQCEAGIRWGVRTATAKGGTTVKPMERMSDAKNAAREYVCTAPDLDATLVYRHVMYSAWAKGPWDIGSDVQWGVEIRWPTADGDDYVEMREVESREDAERQARMYTVQTDNGNLGVASVVARRVAYGAWIVANQPVPQIPYLPRWLQRMFG